MSTCTTIQVDTSTSTGYGIKRINLKFPLFLFFQIIVQHLFIYGHIYFHEVGIYFLGININDFMILIQLYLSVAGHRRALLTIDDSWNWRGKK